MSQMPRPKSAHPTPAELDVLKVLWDRGPSTVREVLEALGKDRAYTSVMSLLNVMTDKGLLKRRPRGRAFVYSAGIPRDATLSDLVGDLWRRAFEESASSLVVHLLQRADPSEAELREIRRIISEYERKQGGNP
jgi:predicted transcriptional regulator